MVPDTAAHSQTPPQDTPISSNDATSVKAEPGNAPSRPAAATSTGAQFPPPKTDKPRPHVCGTCSRSFARLEHLKRHERSHTKEKPFECQECSRCFARRDLLLRHQQKLHYQNNPSTRPKNARRESTSGTSAGGNRVRKNSIANNSVNTTATGPGARPRANTLGHIDLAALGLVDNLPGSHNSVIQSNSAHHRMSMSGAQRPNHLDLRGISSITEHHNTYTMPKFDNNNGMDFSEALYSAPPMTGFGNYDMDQLFTPSGTTINPAQLHFGAPATSSHSNTMPSFPPFGAMLPGIDMEDDYSWMRNWDAQTHNMSNENAIDESSPSRFSSSASQSGFSETVVDAPNGSAQMLWSSHDLSAQAILTPGALNLDNLGSGLPSLDSPQATISPQHLHDPSTTIEPYYDAMMAQSTLSDHHPMNGMHFGFPNTSLSNFDSDSPSVSSASMTDSARHSSVTSMSSESVTEATRQALLNSLSQASGFGHAQRKFSQPSVSSPLSSHGTTQGLSLPGTADLQRYINSYVQYFHPHLPFLHIPTLSFDSPDYVNNMRPAATHAMGHAGIVGGGGCLILAMAAIGALHEFDHAVSKDLFDSAKKMIQCYLEERRRADLSAAVSGQQSFSQEGSAHNTPLWLVQAMLLNVVYGHFSGDKQAADIASTHCAALVSLARAAELAQPAADNNAGTPNIKMEDSQSPFGGPQMSLIHAQWMRWKETEERKRTLFAVFILSSLLVNAYNQPPAIMNSEVLLDLPCDEDLWTAESAQEWVNRGGAKAAEATAMSFETALVTLLHANQRQNLTRGSSGYTHDMHTNTQLRPSTFGCLVLINALHNYIWETRSRHNGRLWTAQETESMFSHIEPALNAWQTAWKSTHHHTLERPNPSGRGPLSADSIPLLDLAFVRLFVNLGRSKEAFWARDFEVMADELARGVEIVQHADGSPAASNRSSSDSPAARNGTPDVAVNHRRQSQAISAAHTSKRERHLRKAAFYAADSLLIASKWNLTFADSAAHELPIQSAMCFFDCCQVLAEWACTVQERVGRYLGIIGQAEIDYTQVPAIMLLETEDVDLLGKIEHICGMMEEKMVSHANMLSALDPSVTGGLHHIERLPGLGSCGLGSKILKVTALMLEKGAVWPVTHVMASALDTQSAHMDQRAESSMTATA